MKLNVPDHIASLVPYPPGKPLEELEREYGISGSIKLASNENPLGPSPKALAAIKGALNHLHRYPMAVVIIFAGNYEKLAIPFPGIVLEMAQTRSLAGHSGLLTPGDEASSLPLVSGHRLAVQAMGGISISVPLKDFSSIWKAWHSW
jgi:histidinol-phosphate aminotransferase